MMRLVAAVSGLTMGSALLRVGTDRGIDQFLTVAPLVEDDSCEGGWHAVHPSFTFKPASNHMVVAFNGLCIKKHRHHVSWHSSLVLGEVAPSQLRNQSRRVIEWRSLEIAQDPRLESDPQQRECIFPSLGEMSGVENARLVRTPQGLYAVANGFQLGESSGERERPACGARGIILQASKVESVSPAKLGKPVALRFPGMGRIEKPWAMFATPDLTGAETRAVYSVYPHTIVKADLYTGATSFEHHTFSKAVERVARMYKTRPGNFNGGAAVAHVRTEDGEYFLSIMHTMVRKNGQDVYWSFPYKFSITAPYGITHVGKRLDLKLLPGSAYGELVARATTVIYDHGDVFIAYSAGDQSSRTIRMPLERFERDHFSTEASFPEPSDGGAFLAQAEYVVLDSELAEVEPFGENPECSDPTFNEMCSDRLSISVCRSCKNL